MQEEHPRPASQADDEADQLEARIVDLALSGKLAHVGLEAVATHRRLGLPLTHDEATASGRVTPLGSAVPS